MGVVESTREDVYAAVWEWSTRAGRQLDLHLVLAQSVRSKGAAGAVKGWPLVDALRQPTQTSRRTGEDALPHLCMWVGGGAVVTQ